MIATDTQAKERVKEWLKAVRDDDGEAEPYLGKRNEPRFFPWSSSMEISCDGQIFLARGLNLSANGVGFICKRDLPRGSVVEIRSVEDEDDLWIPIRIQHSTQSVGSLKVGAKFLFDCG
jgi:hypothetical protein